MTSRFCFRFATSSRLKKGRKPPFGITAYKGCNKSRKLPSLCLRLDEPAPNFTFSGIGRLPARRPYRPSSAQRSFIRGVCAWTKSRLIYHRSYCCYWLLPLSAPCRCGLRLGWPVAIGGNCHCHRKMELGAAPTGFKFARTGQGAPGKWAVVSDPTSSGDRVIEQSSTDRTDYRFPLAIFEPIVARNVEVSISFKPVAGRVDQAGVLRFVLSMRTTITLFAPMRLRITSAFTGSLRVVASKLTV